MKSIFLLICTCVITCTYAQTTQFTNTNGVAIKGFDPVAYFVQQKALEGSNEFTYEWSGSIWKFISPENLSLFKSNPETYAPQFGGYCAYGCSEQHQSPTDPKAYTIIDGKLYLNYSQKVKEIWIKDTANRIPSANLYWKSIHQN